ncbi:MAG: VIT1/CCC1 transporter family protein [Gemmatimonadetes bacterium]|nr:VIT1/CCC1 transporter family protein [Gemmatimonadota bacterium]
MTPEQDSGGAIARVATLEPTTIPGIFRHYLRDLIYGANDGLVTTFAVVAGVTGGDLSARVVLILGLSNLLADGFSMGASNYLSIRSHEAAREAEGLDIEETHAIRHGAATFGAFILAGAVPLLAYLLPAGIADRFASATVFTLATMFGVGATRALVTERRWWTSGCEMLAVGAAAAAVAYGVGAAAAALSAG